MPVILAADGRSLMDRTVVPMTGQITWFLDADRFLQHVAQLWTLNLRVYCQHCHRLKVDDSVRVVFNDSNQTYTAHCQCAKVGGRLPRAEVVKLSGTDELLKRLGWSLCCTGRCAKERGFADGVEAGNDPTGGRWAIRCGCTERVYQCPPQTATVS